MNLDVRHPVIKLVASLARNRGGILIEIHSLDRYQISGANYKLDYSNGIKLIGSLITKINRSDSVCQFITIFSL